MRDHIRDVGRDNQREREIGGEGDGNDTKKGGVHPWEIYVSKLLAIFAFPFNLPTCYASLKWFVSCSFFNYCGSVTISIKVLFPYTFSDLIRITLLLLLLLLLFLFCLLYTSPSPRDSLRSRMPSSA